MNGCTRNSFTRGNNGLPPTDHWLLSNTPSTQCPGVVKKTAVGPYKTLPVPRMGSLADGMVKTGPTPQISLPGLAGDKKSDWVMSPIPLVLLFITGSGWLINGTMVREITFQSSFNCIGTTG